MWIFGIGLVVVLAVIFMNRYECKFYEALPLSFCLLCLFLYGLSFIRGLWLMDGIACVVLVLVFGKLLFERLKRGKGLGTGVTILYPGWAEVAGIGLVILGLVFLTEYKAVSWWDDLNFWATDAKFYYYYGGFAPKYGNVAPEFGDYPPLLSFVKWLFLHCQRENFKEGLLFAAYYSFHIILLLPLLAQGNKKKPFFYFLAVPFLFFIPGIVDFVYVEGCCADVTMGILYGNLLWAIWQDQIKKEFYLLRIAVYGSALVLCKSVGIEWMLFAAVLCLLLKWLRRKNEKGLASISWKACIGTVCVPVLIEGSWLVFCLLNRRVAKLTGAGVRMAVSGNFSFLKQAAHKGLLFMKGFWGYPMHSSRGLGFDISSGCFCLLLFVTVLLLWKKKVLAKKEGKLLLGYLIVTAFLAYGIIFLGHITIFAAEAQYEDPAVMAMSISRYGAPFAMGTFFLLWNIILHFLTEKKGDYAYLPFVLVVLVFTNLTDVKEALISGREYEKNAEIVSSRQDMIEECGQRYVEQGKQWEECKGKRVLYLREEQSIHWVKDAYISYECSPIATVYTGIDTSMMQEKDLMDKILASHASYLYCDDVKGNPAFLFQNMMESGEFQEETFYQIQTGENQIQLVKMRGQSEK